MARHVEGEVLAHYLRAHTKNRTTVGGGQMAGGLRCDSSEASTQAREEYNCTVVSRPKTRESAKGRKSDAMQEQRKEGLMNEYIDVLR